MRDVAGGPRLRRTWRNIEGRVQRALLRDGPERDVPVALVAGAPRSGTTWVGEVIGSVTRSRLLFEPLAPVAVGVRASIPVFPHRRTGDDDAVLRAYLEAVLDGTRRDAWIDARPLTSRPSGRVVKMVRCCLMMGWFADLFPAVAIVFVTRDPWSVVRSRIRMQWDPRPDISALLEQPGLMRRLDERGWGDRVRAVDEGLRDGTPGLGGEPERESGGQLNIEANALLWAVHNAIARHDLRDAPAVHLAYGTLRSRPEQEFGRALDCLSARHGFRPASTAKIRRAAGRASATSAGAEPSAGRAQFIAEFGPDSAKRVARIAESFGLDLSHIPQR